MEIGVGCEGEIIELVFHKNGVLKEPKLSSRKANKSWACLLLQTDREPDGDLSGADPGPLCHALHPQTEQEQSWRLDLEQARGGNDMVC